MSNRVKRMSELAAEKLTECLRTWTSKKNMSNKRHTIHRTNIADFEKTTMMVQQVLESVNQKTIMQNIINHLCNMLKTTLQKVVYMILIRTKHIGYLIQEMNLATIVGKVKTVLNYSEMTETSSICVSVDVEYKLYNFSGKICFYFST